MSIISEVNSLFRQVFANSQTLKRAETVSAIDSEVSEIICHRLPAAFPFKVAYRTRNEFLLYVVNNLPYNRDKEGNDLPQGYVVARALDEITSMKILSRIEGDDSKVTDDLLDRLMKVVEEGLKALTDEEHPVESVSIAKLKEMKQRLSSGYTSFWS